MRPVPDGGAVAMNGPSDTKMESPRDLFEAGRDPFTSLLLDAIGQAVIATTPEGIIRFWNRAATKIYGWPRDEVIGRNILTVTPPKISQDQAAEIMEMLQKGESWSGTFLVQRRDGSTFEAFVTDTPVRDHDGTLIGIIGVSEDLTPRKTAIEALVQSQERFRQAAQTVPGIIFTFDAEGRADYVNERFVEFTGMQARQAVAGGWIDCIHRDDKVRVLRSLVSARRKLRSADVQHRLRMANGSYRWFISRARPFRDDDGALIRWFGTSTDIDDLHRAEEEIMLLNASLESRVAERTSQVRALSSALTLAEQRERKRITQFLHDDIQQLLYAIKLKSDVIASDVDRPAISRQIQQLTASIDGAIEAVRSLTIELNPPILQGEGLDASLEWLAAHMRQVYALDVTVTISRHCSCLNDERRTLLYQIVREALFNVVKHASVDKAYVEMTTTDEWCVIVVEDRGVGFEAGAASQNGHAESLGLFSARQRLALFGGDLEIETAPGRGTKVIIRSPLDG